MASGRGCGVGALTRVPHREIRGLRRDMGTVGEEWGGPYCTGTVEGHFVKTTVGERRNTVGMDEDKNKQINVSKKGSQ